MKVRPLSRDEVRGIDARSAEGLGLPTLVLMENAGRGAAAWLLGRIETNPTARVVIACGPGNNGGDGGVVARHLDARGVAVRVLWFVEPENLRGDAATQRDILARSQIEAITIGPDADLDRLWADADWIVDALLGTGLARPIEGVIGRAIASMNRSNKPILALDLPSGLDADTGLPLGDAVRARATATFVAPKLGFGKNEANRFTGEVVTIEIGLPRVILASFLIPD